MIAREGWYYLGMMGFIIAGAMIRDINLLYIMAGMMLGPLLFSFYAANRSLKKLELKRRFQPLVAVDEPLHVEVSASKSVGSPRALAVLVRDTIYREGESRRTTKNAQLFFSHVNAGTTADRSYCVRFKRRGKYLLGPIKASTGIPLGLVRATAAADEDDFVLVSPKLGVLQPAWSRYLELADDGGQKSVRRHGKAAGDFYGMREWRDGDSRNWIHWRTSAKRSKLTVRQFQQRINQDLVVVLDLYQPKGRAVSSDLAEKAISFAATLVVEQARQGSTQMAVACAGTLGFVLRGMSSPVFRREVMERMATIDVTERDGLADVLAEVLPRTSSNAKIVLVTTTTRSLQDGDPFEELWKRTDVRRSIGDIVQVSVDSTQFQELFQLEDTTTETSDSATLPISEAPKVVAS